MAYEGLIRGIQNGDVSCKEELYQNIKGIIYKEVYSFYNRYRDFLQKCGYMDYDDLVQLGNLIFVKAIDKYKLEKHAEFSTYLTTAIRNYLNSYFFPNKGVSNDYKTNADNLEIDNNIATGTVEDVMFNNLYLKMAIEKLNQEEQELIYDKYYRGLSSKEMVKKYGVTYVTIRKKRENAIKKLKKYMED